MEVAGTCQSGHVLATRKCPTTPTHDRPAACAHDFLRQPATARLRQPRTSLCLLQDETLDEIVDCQSQRLARVPVGQVLQGGWSYILLVCSSAAPHSVPVTVLTCSTTTLTTTATCSSCIIVAEFSRCMNLRVRVVSSGSTTRSTSAEQGSNL